MSSSRSTPRGAPLLRLRQGARGLLDVTGRLFGLEYQEVTDAQRWHEDVSAYDVWSVDGDDRDLLGRIYLDLHPRAGKYSHAAQFDLVAGRQRSAAARGRAGLQLPARPDGAQRRRHAVPRVRPPRAPRPRRAAGLGPVLAASRPSGTSSRLRPSCSRSGPGTTRCCQGSRPTTRASRSRRRSSSGCGAPTSSARASRRGPRCSTRRCPTGCTRIPRTTWTRDGAPTCRSVTTCSSTCRGRTSTPASGTSAATPRRTTRTCGPTSSPRTCSRRSTPTTCSTRDPRAATATGCSRPAAPGRGRPGLGLPRAPVRRGGVRGLAGP